VSLGERRSLYAKRREDASDKSTSGIQLREQRRIPPL